MSEQTALGMAPLSSPALQALKTDGRTREPRVEAQIAEILNSSRNEFWRRASQRDHNMPDWLQEETLVGLLRIWERQGDCEAADRVAELLIDRSARKIARLIACWKVAPHYIEECTRDIQIGMIEAFYSTERNHEFWEVRFWVCLERRVNNVVRRYRTMMEHEAVIKPFEFEDGTETEPLAHLIAHEPVTSQDRVEMGEALALLPEQERIAFILFNAEQWSQQEIAQHLSVTDRTVRNLLARAHKRLAPWRTESIH